MFWALPTYLIFYWWRYSKDTANKITGNSLKTIPTQQKNRDSNLSELVTSDEDEPMTAVLTSTSNPFLAKDDILLDSGATHMVTPNATDLLNPVVSSVNHMIGVCGCCPGQSASR